MQENIGQILLWLVTGIDTVLVTACFWLIGRLIKQLDREQKEQWDAIGQLRDIRAEVAKEMVTKESFEVRIADVWRAIDTLRSSVQDMANLAARSYMPREEVRHLMADVKEDLDENRALIAEARQDVSDRFDRVAAMFTQILQRFAANA